MSSKTPTQNKKSLDESVSELPGTPQVSFVHSSSKQPKILLISICMYKPALELEVKDFGVKLCRKNFILIDCIVLYLLIVLYCIGLIDCITLYCICRRSGRPGRR